MAQFSYIPVQLVNPNTQAILNTVIRCNKGYVLHREGSGIVTLRGIVNNPTSGFARYSILAKSNIAIPTGGTVGPISVAITLKGEPLPDSIVTVTPAAVDSYNGVTTFATIDVPAGCCSDIAFENVSVSATPLTTPAPQINMQNTSVEVIRTA